MALAELVADGKVREIGCSNFSADQLREAADAVAAGAPRFVSVQNQYSLFHRQPELEVLAECERLGIAFIPYFPLMSRPAVGQVPPRRAPPGRHPPGRHACRPPAGVPVGGATLDVVEESEGFAQEHGHSVLELAIAWLAAKAAVASVIAGATKPEQVYGPMPVLLTGCSLKRKCKGSIAIATGAPRRLSRYGRAR